MTQTPTLGLVWQIWTLVYMESCMLLGYSVDTQLMGEMDTEKFNNYNITYFDYCLKNIDVAVRVYAMNIW